jgi:hypothetical protein
LLTISSDCLGVDDDVGGLLVVGAGRTHPKILLVLDQVFRLEDF